MRIVDVCAFYTPAGGGVRTYVERKLKAAPAAGHEMIILAPGRDILHGLKLGIASYSFRGLALDAAIAGMKRLGVKYCSIKNVDNHLKLTATAEGVAGGVTFKANVLF